MSWDRERSDREMLTSKQAKKNAASMIQHSCDTSAHRHLVIGRSTLPCPDGLTRRAFEKAARTAVLVSPSGRLARALYPAADVGTSKSVPYPGICSNRDRISEFSMAVNTARPADGLTLKGEQE